MTRVGALAGLASAAGVDPQLFDDPAVAVYFAEIAAAVAALGDPRTLPDEAGSAFDPAWPEPVGDDETLS